MSNDLRKMLAGRRLLLIGALQSASDLVDLCHRNQVELGASDNVKTAAIKRMADHAYNVDAFDVDGLAEVCERDGFDGVITEYVDRLLPVAADVAEKIGAYSPFTKNQIRMSTDKEFFKRTCMEYGVKVPKIYDFDEREESEVKSEIEFPVLVKPVDNSSSRGLCVCNNIEELREGLKIGRAASHSGRVIVEQYLPYDEINVTYIAQDGNIQLAAIHDRYFNEEQEGVMKVPDLYIYPSKYTDLYYEKANDRVVNMLKEIGIKNGSLFMQAIVHEEEVYFYEAGMRLNGCKTYQILEYENGYNTLEHLMEYCLTGTMGNYQEFNARFKRWYATWNVIGIPGKQCSKFINIDALSSYPWLIKIEPNYAEGEVVRNGTAGTLLQLVARVHILAENKEQLFDRIETMHSLFDVHDESGQSIILRGHKTSDLKKRVNYDLRKY